MFSESKTGKETLIGDGSASYRGGESRTVGVKEGREAGEVRGRRRGKDAASEVGEKRARRKEMSSARFRKREARQRRTEPSFVFFR